MMIVESVMIIVDDVKKLISIIIIMLIIQCILNLYCPVREFLVSNTKHITNLPHVQ